MTTFDSLQQKRKLKNYKRRRETEWERKKKKRKIIHPKTKTKYKQTILTELHILWWFLVHNIRVYIYPQIIVVMKIFWRKPLWLIASSDLRSCIVHPEITVSRRQQRFHTFSPIDTNYLTKAKRDYVKGDERSQFAAKPTIFNTYGWKNSKR